MIISYNWLKKYLPLELDPAEVAEILTSTGLEVEKFEERDAIPGGLRGIVVGQILETWQHPDADRLKVTKVDLGAGEQVQIVCGASNVTEGQKVVVATVGSMLYPEDGEPFKIKKAKLRGQESHGMICAEDEIGMGTDHDGIMVLDSNAQVGINAADYFGIKSDYIFEIGLTPNRSDGNSHIGVARDLLAAINTRESKDYKLVLPDLSSFETGKANPPISVSVKNQEACPRYSSLSISGVKVGASPDWLKTALLSIGQKPINNIVDITNYVLHEYGQPLHAFDQAAIDGSEVIVQNLPEGSKFTTLDEIERKLSSEDLMICNKTEGMCIAGVFGGMKSGVTESTTDVFLESAYFEPIGIRKTSTRHLLRTDAATHYEKGCDPNITIEALKRAALLIQEIAGGTLASPVQDIYPEEIKDFKVDFRPARLNQLAGIEIPKETVRRSLTALEIKIAEESKGLWKLEVPTYRSDVKREADVVEEVLRIYGFDNIPIPETLTASLEYSNQDSTHKERLNVSRYLTGLGLTEIMTNSITQSKFFNESIPMVRLANSMTADLDTMRPSIMETGLEVIRHNLNRQQSGVSLFEFGKTYLRNGDSFQEREMLSILLAGNAQAESWIVPEKKSDFYSLKGYVEAMIQKFGLQGVSYTELDDDRFAYGLAINKGKIDLLRMGMVKPSIAKHFDIKEEVFYAEWDWSFLAQTFARHSLKVKEVPKFPSVRRDLALLLNEEVSFAQISDSAAKDGKAILREVGLFDVYKGDRIEEGKKSYAISLIFQNENKTLTDKEVDSSVNRIVKGLEQKLQAKIRQ